jgi:hypothetical protein
MGRGRGGGDGGISTVFPFRVLWKAGSCPALHTKQHFSPSDENLTGLMSFQKMLQIIQRGNFYKMVLKLGMGGSYLDQN